MNIERLQSLGLTSNEAKVYKSLLELGPSLAGQISRKSGLHRRTVYDVTEMLIKKGLIGYIVKNNRRLFSASNPEKFLELEKEKQENIHEMLPEMMRFYNSIQDKDETLFFKGKAGLKTVFEDQLKHKEILILGANPLAYEVLQFYFNWFDKRRVKEKIKSRIIFNSSTKIRVPYAQVRYLEEKFSSPLAVNIFGNKVAIIFWSKENPFAIVINQKEVAEGYKKYFELMWDISKPQP